MKRIIAILALLLALPVMAVEYQTVMTTTNGTLYKNSAFFTANSNAINSVVTHPTQSADTNAMIRAVLQVYPDSNGTNFWWNFGRTTSSGQTYIYHTIVATNDVFFLGVTNCAYSSILSFNVVASGVDSLISIPTNLPHLDTNGLALSGSAYVLTLTNGNEFRMTIQSNSTLSTLWTTFGQ